MQHKLSYLREKDTPTVRFRKITNEVTLLLTYEATLKDFPTEDVEESRRRSNAPRSSGSRERRSPSARCSAPGWGCSTGCSLVLGRARRLHRALPRRGDARAVPSTTSSCRTTSRTRTRSCSTRCSRRATRASRRSGRDAGARTVTLVCLVAAPEGVERVHAGRPEVRIVGVGRPRAERRGCRPGPRRRRGTGCAARSREFVDTLRDNPEVIPRVPARPRSRPAADAGRRAVRPVHRRGGRTRGDTARSHPSSPRLGGIALLLGIFVPALAFLDPDRPYRGILLGAAIATTVGAIDDFRRLPWWEARRADRRRRGRRRLRRDRRPLHVPGLRQPELPEWAAGAATIFWVVAIMNMVNFLDGMDGLAAGICAIAGSTFAIIGLSLGVPEAALLSAIVAGACFGFCTTTSIRRGSSWATRSAPPRLLLATLAIEGLVKTALATLVLPLSCWQSRSSTRRSSVRRPRYRRPRSAKADQAHLHHRFISIGFSQKRAVVYMYAWCGILAAAALSTRFLPPRPGGEWDVSNALVAGHGAPGGRGLVYIAYLLGSSSSRTRASEAARSGRGTTRAAALTRPAAASTRVRPVTYVDARSHSCSWPGHVSGLPTAISGQRVAKSTRIPCTQASGS